MAAKDSGIDFMFLSPPYRAAGSATELLEICAIKFKSNNEKECIPVGCVPPTAVAIQGGLHQAPPGNRHPPDRHPRDQAPPWEQAPPTPRSRHPLPLGSRHPLPKSRHPLQSRHPPVNRILDTRL